MKQLVAVFAVLLLAACGGPPEPMGQAPVDDAVVDQTVDNMEGVDEVDQILEELDNLDAELDLDQELAALDQDLQ